jgi:solute carrier family 40 (iron-regulated transporter), member 1
VPACEKLTATLDYWQAATLIKRLSLMARRDDLVATESHEPLLGEIDPGIPHPSMPAISRRLYISHFLSTWNTRVFEFGAVLYLASIFPNSLLPMSVYALIRGLSAVLFAPALGRFIDATDRLVVVRTSIGK